jgi:hypothetical protein
VKKLEKNILRGSEDEQKQNYSKLKAPKALIN